MLVVIGELFQHRESRFLLAVFVGDFHHLRRRVLAIDVGALQREIDESGNDFVFPDRNLAQQQRRIARFLQHGENIAQRPGRLVDLVDIEKMRNAQIGEPLQIGLQHLHFGGLGFDHDDGRIDTLDRK